MKASGRCPLLLHLCQDLQSAVVVKMQHTVSRDFEGQRVAKVYRDPSVCLCEMCPRQAWEYIPQHLRVSLQYF